MPGHFPGELSPAKTDYLRHPMDADLLTSMHDEGYDGGILFEWHDEWFKFTWNTVDLELPAERRALWHNRLTNEENFGVIAVEPGESPNDLIALDGKTGDWERRNDTINARYPDLDLSVAHDAAHLYLLLRKQAGAWDFASDQLDIGFGVLPGGSHTANQAPGITFSEGIQFLLQIKGQQDSRLLVNSAYDQHTWLYAAKLKMLPATPGDGEVGASAPQTIAPTLYRWDRWDTPIYHERQKSSYAILRDAFAAYTKLRP